MAEETEAFEAFQAEADDGAEWEVSWDDGTSRNTTLAAMAWFASKDDEATVERVL